MTRIDELQKKYPTIPRDLFVKYEVWGRGVRYTKDLDKVSSWTPPSGSYQTKYDDQTLKEMAAEQPQRLKEGYFLRPRNFMMKSTLGARICLKRTSPYEIREIADGKFALFEEEEKIDVDLYFPRPTPREGPEPVTSRGTPISRLVSAARNCFFVVSVRHCEYFPLGEQCKFCNLNPSQEDARSVGLNRPVTENLDEVLEAIKILGSEVRLVEGRTDMGGFMNAEQEERIYSYWMERLAGAVGYKPNLTAHTEALTRKQLQRLKDAGLDCYMLHMEVWEPQLFSEVCPGKAKHAPFEAWMEALSDAIDVFGVGNVSTMTIDGLSLMPENGHNTWQEGRDSHIEHVRSMIKMGVFPSFQPLALSPGSVYGAVPSLKEKLPPTDYHFDLMLAHHEAMEEHGLYEKLNKFMQCSLDVAPTGPYSGEIGILQRAGNFGNWMADVVPDKANWILQFLKSIGAAAPAPAGGGQ